MEFFSLGERITIYRRRAGFTQTKLAKTANISVSTLSKYENDTEDYPDIETVSALAAALDVSINKLIVGVEDPKARKELMALVAEMNV